MYIAVVTRNVNVAAGAMLLRAAALVIPRLAETLETSLPLLALPPLLLDPLPLLPPLPLDVSRAIALKVGAGVPFRKMLLTLGAALEVLATGLAEGGAVATTLCPIGLAVGTAVGVLVTGLAEGGAVGAIICPTGLAVGTAVGGLATGATTSVNPLSKIRRKSTAMVAGIGAVTCSGRRGEQSPEEEDAPPALLEHPDELLLPWSLRLRPPALVKLPPTAMLSNMKCGW
jgi:hypothetical protein